MYRRRGGEEMDWGRKRGKSEEGSKVEVMSYTVHPSSSLDEDQGTFRSVLCNSRALIG